jgi:hypothetical protein
VAIENPSSATAHKLRYRVLPGKYGVCKLAPGAAMPSWPVSSTKFFSITRTSEELSIVCSEDTIPSDLKGTTRWTCLKIEGPFAFTQTGILTSFVGPLSSHSIPIFVIATFDTDYVLIPEEFSSTAHRVLAECGHQLVGISESLNPSG